MSMNAAASPIVPVWRWLRNPAFWVPAADLFAVLAALALPWSTSLVGIFTACWLGAVALTIDYGAYLKFAMRPICALPSVFFGLTVIGTLWSDASWAERVHAIFPALKLLFIPALLFHFQRSSRGDVGARRLPCLLHALDCDVVDCGVQPGLALKPWCKYGVPVKNYIDQSRSSRFALSCWPIPSSCCCGTEKWPAGVGCCRAGFVSQYDFHSCAAHRAGHDADHAGRVRALHLRWRTNSPYLAARLRWRRWPGQVHRSLQWTTETFSGTIICTS